MLTTDQSIIGNDSDVDLQLQENVPRLQETVRLLKFFNIKSNKMLNNILAFMEDTSIFHLYQRLTPDQII